MSGCISEILLISANYSPERYEGEVGELEAGEAGGPGRVTGAAATEAVSLFALTECDNTLLGRVVLSLASLTEELERAEEEGKRLMSSLLVFSNDGGVGEVRLAVGRLVPSLHSIHCHTEHCRDLLANLLAQLSALLGPGSPVRLKPGRLEVNEAQQQLLIFKDVSIL